MSNLPDKLSIGVRLPSRHRKLARRHHHPVANPRSRGGRRLSVVTPPPPPPTPAAPAAIPRRCDRAAAVPQPNTRRTVPAHRAYDCGHMRWADLAIGPPQKMGLREGLDSATLTRETKGGLNSATLLRRA